MFVGTCRNLILTLTKSFNHWIKGNLILCLVWLMRKPSFCYYWHEVGLSVLKTAELFFNCHWRYHIGTLSVRNDQVLKMFRECPICIIHINISTASLIDDDNTSFWNSTDVKYKMMCVYLCFEHNSYLACFKLGWCFVAVR